MGLCPSKAQQPQEDVGKDYGVQAAPVDPASNRMQVGNSSSSSSPLPDRRPASTESGQPAAAAGDGAPQSSPTSHPRVEAMHSTVLAPGNESSSVPTAQQPSSQPGGLTVGENATVQECAAGPAPAESQRSRPAPAGPAPAESPPTILADKKLPNGSVAPDMAASGAVLAGAPTRLDGCDGPQQQPPQSVLQPQQPLTDVQQPLKQWDRSAGAQVPSALASSGTARPPSQSARSVKFADPVPESEDGSTFGGDSNQRLSRSVGGAGPSSSTPGGRRGLPRRSSSSSALRSGPPSNEVSEAVLAKQAEILRSNKAGKLRMRRGGLDSSFAAMQDALTQDGEPIDHVATRAAGLKHIGFGPFKRENQDEFFIQVGDFGGVAGGNLFCVFDGHGTHGKDAALYSRQLLPRMLDNELRKYFTRVGQDSEAALRGAVEVLITEVFGDTERNLAKSGVNLASSGTTASVAFQRGNRLWVAAAGDSRAILCTRNARDQWRALPLTIDHRPRRTSERERIEAAGARVAPKRLPSGRSVGEPRLWLQDAGGPGLLLSRSLGDLTAATVGCTSDPEVTFTTLRPHTDQVLVMATDGVWDVLTNEQVCDIVVESPDPHIACRRVLDAALYEWEERMSADNITVLVVEFEWNEDGVAPAAIAHAVEHVPAGMIRPDGLVLQQTLVQQPAFQP